MKVTSAAKAVHIMTTPSGSAGNVDCSGYCFLKMERLTPGSNLRISDEVHQSYILQLFEGRPVPQLMVTCRGGEPTLMSLDFFRCPGKTRERCVKPEGRITNLFSNNGILLSDEWCRFLHEHNFLVGLGVDGPKELHDFHRQGKRNGDTFEGVMRALKLLKRHQVEFNIVCTVDSKNADHPLEVYRFFRDELQAQYIRFIPVVERENKSGLVEGGMVTDRFVRPHQWGQFQINIFDEWIKKDVGRTFVLNIDSALAGWLGNGPDSRAHMRRGHGRRTQWPPSCSRPSPRVQTLREGIFKTPETELEASDRQQHFGRDKWDMPQRNCLQCDFLPVCNGECPKNRLGQKPDAERARNYLYEGYKKFFEHVDRPMKIMAGLIRRGRQAGEVMKLLEPESKGEMQEYQMQ